MVFAGPRNVGLCSNAMPHFGQLPGVLLSTLSHIGQKYFFVGLRSAAADIVSIFESW